MYLVLLGNDMKVMQSGESDIISVADFNTTAIDNTTNGRNGTSTLATACLGPHFSFESGSMAPPLRRTSISTSA